MKKVLYNHMLTVLSAVAFDPGNPGWKTGEDGKIEAKDGNPIWVDANGEEKVMAGDTISRLNSDAKQLRLAKEAAEKKLEAFAGIKDVDAALKAIETVKNIDAKKLIDAGKVDEVKAEITKEFQTQLSEKDKAYNELKSQFDGSLISNLFAQSEFIRERIAVPRDMFEATFKSNFKVVDGKIEAYDRSGNRLMSKKTIGDHADPQEAIELLVDQHPQKDVILKATTSNGTGSGGAGGNRGGGAKMSRADWDKLQPHEQAQASARVRSNELTIVD